MGAEPPVHTPAPQVQEQREPVPDEEREELSPAPDTHSHQPCPICGGTEFRWDWLESGLWGRGKNPAGAEQQKYVKRKTRFGDFMGLRARLCENCGHVDLFTQRAEES